MHVDVSFVVPGNRAMRASVSSSMRESSSDNDVKFVGVLRRGARPHVPGYDDSSSGDSDDDSSDDDDAP